MTGLLIAAFMLLMVTGARGASPEPGDPYYHSLRYDDDFSYLADPAKSTDFNIYDVRPVVSFKPVPDVLATFGWDTLWRVSSADGLYGSAMVEYANTSKVTGARVGTELSADVRWRIDRHLAVGAIAAEFLSGPAVQEALGKNVTFFTLFATYRF